MLAVADSMERAGINSKLLLSQDLDPLALEDHVRRTNMREQALLNPAAEVLYDHLLREVCNYTIEIAVTLPPFASQAAKESLRRETEIIELIHKVLINCPTPCPPVETRPTPTSTSRPSTAARSPAASTGRTIRPRRTAAQQAIRTERRLYHPYGQRPTKRRQSRSNRNRGDGRGRVRAGERGTRRRRAEQSAVTQARARPPCCSGLPSPVRVRTSTAR